MPSINNSNISSIFEEHCNMLINSFICKYNWLTDFYKYKYNWYMKCINITLKILHRIYNDSSVFTTAFAFLTITITFFYLDFVVYFIFCDPVVFTIYIITYIIHVYPQELLVTLNFFACQTQNLSFTFSIT